MDMETALVRALSILNAVHVPGMDSEKFGIAINDIKACVRAIEKAKKQVDDEKKHKGENADED